MTVPQRLSFSAQLSNCNLATCWHIELSILGLLHLSISIHLTNSLNCSMKFFCLKIALGLALGESWPLLAQPQKDTDVHKGMLLWESFPKRTCKSYLGRKQGCKLMDQVYTTIRLRQPWEELVPWERTPWPRKLQHTPKPHTRQCPYPTMLSNCSLATCWHIELSILGLLHLSISIHLTNSLNCSMKFFCLKIALGLALAKSWPLLAQPQKDTDVHKGMLLWESFPKRTCKSYLGRKQGCKLMDQVYTTSLLRQPWEELVPWERTPCPRKLQHTPKPHTRQCPYPTMKGFPLHPVGKGLGVCSKGVLKQP